ncbi:hypothetical protein [Streptomyces sp. MST-110588]|uniref:hypothetical protein n=1 Tax=Streptomyces sp. MST-110588 TaxID=2833628 RepID=UPI001F5E332F|nr:hypothetical protein [Streptomyces sp. MST-110588]
MVLAVGCGGTQSDGKASPGGASASKTAAHPLPMQTTTLPATWTDSDHKAHPLRVTPKSLMRGSVSDFEHIRLDGDLKGLVPYYLTVSYSNTDSKTLSRATPLSNFSVNGADGEPAKQIMMFSNPLATSSGMPEQCRKGSPDSLAAGASAEACKVFMLPPKQQPVTVSYKDDKNDKGEPLIWKVGSGKGDAASGVLAAGKAADSGWQDSKNHDVTVRVTPKSVRAGSIADLSRFKLNDEEKKQIPYYVTVEYRNTGTYDLYPSMQEGVTLRGASGQQARKMMLIDIGGDGVKQCPETVPDKMVKPQGTVTQCSIHLMPKGDRPATVVFTGRGSGAQPLTWHATDGEK